MVEILNRASVKILHHVEVTCVAPVFDLNLGLSALLHSIHEHASKVFTLSGEDGFVSVDGFLFN